MDQRIELEAIVFETVAVFATENYAADIANAVAAVAGVLAAVAAAFAIAAVGRQIDSNSRA